MAEKYKINRVVDEQGTLAVVHPETDAEQVLYTNTIGGAAVKNVDEALNALKTLAQNSGVTGVKGNSETTYRTGQVNITPANIGLGNVNNTSDANKPVSTAQQTAINTAKSGAISDAKSYTDTQLASYIKTSDKGVAGGVATLGTDGKVPSSQLPSYVDDIKEGYFYGGKFYAQESHIDIIAGEVDKIYVDLHTDKTYRWSGLRYVEISASLALGETSSTAYAGDKGKQNASKISALEDVVYEILDDERNVGTANNAIALGGVPADQYAKLTDIECFIVTFIENTTTRTWTADKTFAEIRQAVADGKVVIGTDYDYVYQLFYEQNDGITFSALEAYDDRTFVQSMFIDTDNSVHYVTNTLVAGVNDNGTGAIVSKIEKSGGQVNVTRRAMQNSDLPNSGVTAGVYSAVQVNSKGVVTAGNQIIEWGTNGQTTPSASLAIGGLFFMKV